MQIHVNHTTRPEPQPAAARERTGRSSEPPARPAQADTVSLGTGRTAAPTYAPGALGGTGDTLRFETPTGFLSASALDGDQNKGLRISKMILGRRLDPDHIRQLLASGRTELITGFISKKKKPFDAYLLLDAKGKLSFEFPPRAKKGPAKKTAADNEPTGSA